MSLLTKKYFALILLALLILTGCMRTDDGQAAESQTKMNEDEQTSSIDGQQMNENQQNPTDGTEGAVEDQTEPNSEDGNVEEPMFEVRDSEISGWKELICKDYAYTTQDWDSYSYHEDAPLISYSLHFPEDWKVQYGVFVDEEGQKVAELFPPIIMQDDQTLLDNWKVSSDSEFISRKEISVGELTGEKIVLKVFPHSGDITEWYAHTYYLTDGKKVFAMSFYDVEVDGEKLSVFDDIIQSFNFLE